MQCMEYSEHKTVCTSTSEMQYLTAKNKDSARPNLYIFKNIFC